MMKLLIALTSMLALCAGQLNNLTHTRIGSRWSFPSELGNHPWKRRHCLGDSGQSRRLGFHWRLSLMSNDGKYADVIFGGYNDEFSFGYVEDWSLEWVPGTVPGGGSHLLPFPDESQDIVLQKASFSTPNTILRVKRSLNTGDYYDVPIHSGQMPIGWAYSTSDAYDSVHAAAGFAYVTFY